MKKVLFISSDGGHLDELLHLGIEDYEYRIVTEKTKSNKNLGNKYENKVDYLLYGTRKNLFKYFFVLLINYFKSRKIFKKFQPDVVVSTGSHTALFMCLIAKKAGKKVIWIETFANRNTPTMAGKMIYKHVDVFVVQWKEMLKVYPNAVYWGPIY